MARDRAPLPLNSLWFDWEFDQRRRVTPLPALLFGVLVLLCLAVMAVMVWSIRR